MPEIGIRREGPHLVVLLAITAVPAFAQRPQEFGAATFVAPIGWTVESNPRLQVFSWVRGPNRCLIVVTPEEPAPPDLPAAFASAWRALLLSGYRSAQMPTSQERTSASGARYSFGEGELEDPNGNRLIARMHVFLLRSTSQWIVLLGSGNAALAGCRSSWEEFFASVRLRSLAMDPTPSVRLPGEAPASEPPASRAGGVTAADGKQAFENLLFLPPPGWSLRRNTGMIHLSAAGVRDPERLEVLLLRGHLAVSLEQAVEATWVELQSLLTAELMRNVSGKAYDLGEPSRSLTGVEYLKANGAMRIGGAEFDVTVYALRAGDRIERVAVLARAFTEKLTRFTTASHPRYAKDIRRLVFRMRFANQSEKPLAPAGLEPAGIVGVWAGLGVSFGTIKPEIAVFFDNGLAYFGPRLPLEGLDAIDPVVEQPAHRRDWGTYTWDGNAGVLRMPYGEIPLRSTGSRLELTTNRTPHRYLRLVMPASGYLDGTWCVGDGACLRFAPDGRFEDQGAIRIAEHSLYAWPATPASGKGRYTLRDHTLHLAYDGGPELRIAFPGLEDGNTSSPSALRLGWNVDLLTRR
jgi:hypothetical protein